MQEDVKEMMPHDIIHIRLIFCACPVSLLLQVQVLIIFTLASLVSWFR
jgi:hypothetical protein